jgi:hypothetical protein
MLADLHPLIDQLCRKQDDERIPGEFLDLRPLVPVADVFERQRVKPERLLEQLEVGIARILDVEPEALGSLLEAGEQAVGCGIERWAVGRDNMADRALRLIALSLRQVGRRGAGPRRLYRWPT